MTSSGLGRIGVKTEFRCPVSVLAKNRNSVFKNWVSITYCLLRGTGINGACKVASDYKALFLDGVSIKGA